MVQKVVCLVALGVLLATPAAADARRARPVADSVFAGTTTQGVPGYVKVLPHGRGLEIVFSYFAECSDGEAGLFWRGVSGVPLRRGHFRYSQRQSADSPDITIDGRFGKKSVSGTWHVSFSVPDDAGGTVTCDSGLVPWTVQKAAHGGRSSDGYPIIASLDKDRVRMIQLAAGLKCQSGVTRFWASPYSDFPISASGAFGDAFDDAIPGPDNGQVKVRVEIRGHVGRIKVKGTARITGVVLDSAGNQVDSCDSGPLTWSLVP
jgi:hypothetical protein